MTVMNHKTDVDGIDIAKIGELTTDDSAVEIKTAPSTVQATTDIPTDDQIDPDELKTQDSRKTIQQTVYRKKAAKFYRV